jgi:hypothetical protein
MLNIRHFLLFVSLFIIVPNAFGQDEKKSIELKKILDDIAQLHNVKFSYLEEDIKFHSIYPPEKNLPLKAKLVYIANRTRLNYKETGDYIVLYTAGKAEGENENKKLCAYLIDEVGYPIDDAVIQLMPGNKKIVTGADGYFELPGMHAGTLYIGHLGYENMSIRLQEFTEDCKEIVLKLETQELDELITERYLATGISKKKDGSFAIKPKKFGILPGLIEPDVLQAMQQLPGINSIDETVSNINVRGGTHDQNLFMWNGIRLFQTGHFFGLISALNPNLAHDIRIFKNGTPASYGESVSSAIDISSRPQDIGEGSTSIGTNMIGVDFYTKIKASDKANFEISARRSFTDAIDFPTYSKYSKRIFQNTIVTSLNNSTDVNYKSDKEFYFYDFTGQYHQKIGSKHDLYVDMIGINNRLDFTQGTITATNVVTELSNLKQLTLGGTVGWRTQWSDNHSTEVGIYGSYYNVDAKNASLEFNQVVLQQNKILDAGFRFSSNNRLNKYLNLHTGYQYNEIGIENSDDINEPEYSRDLKEVLRTHALTGEMEYDSEDGKVHSRAGIRGNYIESLGMIYAEPRLQFNYKLADSWQLEVLAEQKSQTATQVVELQGDFLGIEKRRWVLANDTTIPVQKSRQASIGFSYKDNGWLLSLENFYKKVKGITTGGQAFQNQLEQVQATGSYTVYGTEFLVQKQFKGFYAWLSYSWNNNNYSFNGVTPDKFPNNFEISHTVNSAAIYEWNNFKVALGSKWFTGRPVTTPLSNVPAVNANGTPEIVYSSPNANNIANFFQVNFSALYVIKANKKSQLQLGISVLNIFNRKNIINRYYRINNASDGIEVVNTYSLERTPNALIKFTF